MDPVIQIILELCNLYSRGRKRKVQRKLFYMMKGNRLTVKDVTGRFKGGMAKGCTESFSLILPREAPAFVCSFQ